MYYQQLSYYALFLKVLHHVTNHLSMLLYKPALRFKYSSMYSSVMSLSAEYFWEYYADVWLLEFLCKLNNCQGRRVLSR